MGMNIGMWQRSEIWLVLPTVWQHSGSNSWTYISCRASSLLYSLGMRLWATILIHLKL